MNIDLFFKKVKEICGHNINDYCNHRNNIITTARHGNRTDCQMAYCPFVRIVDEILYKK